jgi:proliferating cell nuclear antigen
MKFSVASKPKKDIFISLFQLLKNCSTAISMNFEHDRLYIQGMDKSHVCLFEVSIRAEWFTDFEYEAHGEQIEICVDTAIFHNVLAMNQERHVIHVEYDFHAAPDNLTVELVDPSGNKSGGGSGGGSGGEFDKFFKLPLADFESQLLNIPDVDYDTDFSVPAKKIAEIANQLLLFGDTMHFLCNEDKIELSSSGISGQMAVNIPIDDLTEFSISEGETIDLFYSLQYIQKMCLSTKLSPEIAFSISNDYPMRIKYDLGESSHVIFFIAPKIVD